MLATISACGKYRYRLERELGQIGPTVMFLMVNPSTADATQDDPTIRKCKGFASKLGGGTLLVGNLFAYRATDVTELRKTRDPVGPDNDKHLREMLYSADIVIAAWGSLNKLPEVLRPRWKDVVRLADERVELTGERRCRSLSCIGVCADKHPKHPLMVGYDTPVTAWTVPWFPNRDAA